MTTNSIEDIKSIIALYSSDLQSEKSKWFYQKDWVSSLMLFWASDLLFKLVNDGYIISKK